MLRFFSFAAACGLLWSCVSDRETILVDKDDSDSYVKSIAAFIATRTDEDDDNSGENSDDSNGIKLEDLIPYSLKFNNTTVLQLSQKGRSTTPFVTEKIYNYEFIDSYVEQPDDWDNEASYNFVPQQGSEPLEWNTIAATGSADGTFQLYCMYFPVLNKIMQYTDEDSGAITYYVPSDQSTRDSLMRADILGAYHTSKEVFSRLRFKLYHLMTYLRIRLYVPEYDPELHTGYGDNALEKAVLTNVNPNFGMEWSAIRNTEQPPLILPLSGESEIIMYEHEIPENGERPKAEIPYQQYLPSQLWDQGLPGEVDKVRVYDFSVIIPKQKDVDGTSFTKTNFLNFYLRTISGSPVRYYFNQELFANSNESSLELNQGNFQYLELYLPRVGNYVVYVGATVKPWNQMETEIFLKPDEIQ